MILSVSSSPLSLDTHFCPKKTFDPPLTVLQTPPPPAQILIISTIHRCWILPFNSATEDSVCQCHSIPKMGVWNTERLGFAAWIECRDGAMLPPLLLFQLLLPLLLVVLLLLVLLLLLEFSPMGVVASGIICGTDAVAPFSICWC